MGTLFISHSSSDNDQAIKVCDWLKGHGWKNVFLDLDPQRGLATGHRWEDELKRAGERCAGVVVLISPDWVASRWCQAEFLAAKLLGKRIFPLFVAPTPFDDVPPELKGNYQIADISSPEMEPEGFERLAVGLKRAGLDPTSFPWPPPGDPHRAVYRGLQTLEEEDAAIFFGRDAQITEALDALRRMRQGDPKRMLVIQAASGAGKSSFLRAGIIARLKRDEENFVVLPAIRPERAAISGAFGLAASLACRPNELQSASDIVRQLEQIRARVIDRLERFAQSAGEEHIARPPAIIVPIDQAEELFNAENVEAAGFLELLSAGIMEDGNTILVCTIRTDAFSRVQEEQRLAAVPLLPFSLSAIPSTSFKDVIEGPARLSDPPLAIEPALTEQLLEDLAADDALPLLAFTLERLLRGHRGQGALTLGEYRHELGGLEGAIVAAVESAFAKAMRDPSLPRDRAALDRLAQSAFVPALVQIDDADAEPRRRVERFDKLPEASRPLVRHLIDERLLVTDHRLIDGIKADTVEVAHEAILRQWPVLRSWISGEREGLRALDGVRTAARDWRTHGGAQGWLAHGGGRLEEAERLLTPAHFANALGPAERDYLATCRARENAERERERNEMAREKKNIVRTRRLQRNIFVLIAAAVAIVLLAGFGIAELLKGIAIRSSDALAKLSEQAADNQDYEAAARYAIAGLAGADWPLVGYPGSRATVALRSADMLSSRIAILRGHNGSVGGIAYSPDGTRIVTASADRTARIWDAKTGAQLAVLRGHDGTVRTAAYSPDGARIVTASEDKTARIWDAKTGAQLAVLRGDGYFLGAAYSPDGRRIVTANDDNTARVWDAHTGAQMAVLRGHNGYVETAMYSPDGTRIVTASDDKTARIWDAQTGAQLAILRGHDRTLDSAAYSPDGTRIVTASVDGTARIWDAKTGAQLAVLRGHDAIVQTAAYSPDGTRIVTSSVDKTARVWDAKTGAQLAILRGHGGYLNSAAYSPDGTRIVTASDDGTARIWDATAGAHFAVLRGHDASVDSVAYSPDGTRIVTASADRTARIWDATTGAQLAVLRGHDSTVDSAAYSSDGTRIVTASDDATARIWDAKTGAQLAVLSGHDGDLESAAYSPDGTRIVTASVYKSIARIWDTTTGAGLAVLRGHDSAVASVAYSPDGTRIVTASADKTARIWNAKTGAQLAVLRGHDGIVRTAAYSPDGGRIVTASDDKTARIWDAVTGSQLTVLHGHDATVYSAAYSPDGTRVVTASVDDTARIWDARTGTQLAVLRGHDGHVDSAMYSPDGTRIVTASDDKTMRIWRSPQIDASWLSLPRKALIARTCTTLLSGGLDLFSNEELAAAPDLDPTLDADACHPPSLWARLRELVLASRAH